MSTTVTEKLAVSARPAYKLEELLALRSSISESTVSLDRFGDEEAIKGKPTASIFRTSALLKCQHCLYHSQLDAFPYLNTKKPHPAQFLTLLYQFLLSH